MSRRVCTSSASSSCSARTASRSATGGLVLGLGAEQLLPDGTGRRAFLAARPLHCVDHDPDQDVDDQEPRDQHVADEVDPRPGVDLHPGPHVAGPLLERQHHEQVQHRVAEVPPAAWILGVKEQPSHHPVQVDEKHREHGHAPDRRQAANHPPQQHPHVGEHADDPDDPQEADEPQQSRVLSQARHERGRDDDEVEHVPPVAEEVLGTTSVGGDPDRELHQEDAETGVVRRRQHATDPIVHGVVGLEPEHDRVEDDDAEDERLKAPRVGDPLARLAYRAHRTPHEPRKGTRTGRRARQSRGRAAQWPGCASRWGMIAP